MGRHVRPVKVVGSVLKTTQRQLQPMDVVLVWPPTVGYAVANLTQLVHQTVPSHPRYQNRLEQPPPTRDEFEEATDVEVCEGIACIG